MPPKAKVTKDMVVDAAIEVARESGGEAISARSVSEKLNCSTQPVMYHFSTIEALKRAAYLKADAYHSAWLLDIHSENPMKDMGLNYIRFGAMEKNLFRFLFQSNAFSEKTLSQLIDAEEIQPVILAVSREAEVSMEQAKQVFRVLFLMVHGYASMLANNEMEFDEKAVSSDLALMFYGAVCGIKGGQESYVSIL